MSQSISNFFFSELEKFCKKKKHVSTGRSAAIKRYVVRSYGATSRCLFPYARIPLLAFSSTTRVSGEYKLHRPPLLIIIGRSTAPHFPFIGLPSALFLGCTITKLLVYSQTIHHCAPLLHRNVGCVYFSWVSLLTCTG